MTKEQINYLLALATLFVVWLYFNTFYANAAKRGYSGNPLAGLKAVVAKAPNAPVFPKIPEAPFTKISQVNRADAPASAIPVMPAGDADKS